MNICEVNRWNIIITIIILHIWVRKSFDLRLSWGRSVSWVVFKSILFIFLVNLMTLSLRRFTVWSRASSATLSPQTHCSKQRLFTYLSIYSTLWDLNILMCVKSLSGSLRIHFLTKTVFMTQLTLIYIYLNTWIFKLANI